MGIENMFPEITYNKFFKNYKFALKNIVFSKMADRNQVKIIIHVLKNASRRIPIYLGSRILKIGLLVQKLQILQVTWEPR